MEAYVTSVGEEMAAQVAAGRMWHEFLRVEALSGGLYVLEPGDSDPQQPHREDEVYVVVQGRGALRVGTIDHLVQAGSIAYVPAQVAHHFHTIVERLVVLVFFAPAETLEQPAPAAGHAAEEAA